MTSRLREVALASISPRRSALLRSLGLEVTIIPSDYDEGAADANCGSAADCALRHAVGKARAAAASGPPLLIAADTIVAVDGRMLGKPPDAAGARAMLRSLSGRRHTVYTGYAVVDRAAGRHVAEVSSAQVLFLDLDDDTIVRYVETGEPMDKAGAYAVQGLGSLFVSSITGDFYTVMGLPLARLGLACKTLGYEII